MNQKMLYILHMFRHVSSGISAFVDCLQKCGVNGGEVRDYVYLRSDSKAAREAISYLSKKVTTPLVGVLLY